MGLVVYHDLVKIGNTRITIQRSSDFFKLRFRLIREDMQAKILLLALADGLNWGTHLAGSNKQSIENMSNGYDCSRSGKDNGLVDETLRYTQHLGTCTEHARRLLRPNRRVLLAGSYTQRTENITMVHD